jgi:hypothetical protein
MQRHRCEEDPSSFSPPVSLHLNAASPLRIPPESYWVLPCFALQLAGAGAGVVADWAGLSVVAAGWLA